MQYWDRPRTDDWADELAGSPSARRLAVHRSQGMAAPVGTPAPRRLRTADYFGELGLLDGAPRSATVVATQELHVMVLPGQSVLRLARRQPAVTLAMVRNLSTQLRRLEARVAS